MTTGRIPLALVIAILAITVLTPTALMGQQDHAKVTIRQVNGIPRLFVGDEAVPMLAYRNRIHDDAAYMKQFADAGVRVFFMTHLIDWDKGWDEHFAEVSRRLDAILDFNDRTVVVLGMYLSCSPQWAKDHPDELLWQNGKPRGPLSGEETHSAMYSLASREFETEAVGIVKRYVEFLNKYPRRSRVIGLFFEGGAAQEWNPFDTRKHYYDHPDTGPAMLRAYREYAQAKYKTDDALAKAYGQEGLTFQTLQIPDAELSLQPDVGDFFDPHKGASLALMDFWRTQSKEIADRMLAMGRAAKALSPNLLCGAFHEPLMDEAKYSYNDQRVLDSPYLDFFAGPPAYEMRQIQDHLPIHHVINSVQARGKLFFVEEDLRPYGMRMRRGATSAPTTQVVQDTITIYQRDVLHDQTVGCMAWIWDFQSKWFGQEKAYFDAFKTLEQIGLLNIQAKVKPVSQIAVLVDEDAKYFIRGDNRLIRNVIHRELTSEMGLIGAPYDIWLVKDVAREDFPLDRYKLIVALNCYSLTDADRKAIERLKGGKRTILWLHASGFINEDRPEALSVKNMTELTGLQFGRYDQRAATVVATSDKANELTASLPPGYMFGQFFRMTDNGKAFPPITRVSPIFAIEDSTAVAAGWYALENIHPPAETSTDKAAPIDVYGDAYYVGLAYKKFEDWTSIYAGVVAVPAEFLRAAAKFAGVHVYVDGDDIVYANSQMVVLHTNLQAGPRTIKLPQPGKAYDLLDGLKPVSDQAVSEFTIQAKPTHTYAWWLADQPPVLPQVPPKTPTTSPATATVR